ncbi:porin [Robbsia sp. KACC 23696]|uniref:porin n=1 Tax=Robbsia sp. KACC 23696 TaxID=3149231 RepID=UPI00325B8881
MNKHSRLALVLASACALHAAHAQSSVTMYGIIDNAIEYQNGGAGAAVRMMSSGLYATVYGLKGKEDLGGGLYANFQLEQGFSAATGAATVATAAFNRLAWVGLSGPFGEFRFGRQKKPEYQFLNGVMDPIAGKSLASPYGNFEDVAVRANNAIAYFTPNLYGLTTQFMVAMRDQTTKPTNGLELYNVAARYTNGPFVAGLGYEQWGNATGTALQRVLRGSLVYRMGKARFFLAYQQERQSDNTENRRIYQLSAIYMFNPFNSLTLLYGYAQDRTGAANNAQQVGAMYQYYLSKRTLLYAAVAVIQNKNQAAYTLNGTQYDGIPVAPGSYARGVIVGMAHKF